MKAVLYIIQTQKVLPEDDVAVSTYVSPTVHNFCPVFPWPHSKLAVALVGEGLEVPWLWLKHVSDAVCAHWHYHLGTALQILHHIMGCSTT